MSNAVTCDPSAINHQYSLGLGHDVEFTPKYILHRQFTISADYDANKFLTLRCHQKIPSPPGSPPGPEYINDYLKDIALGKVKMDGDPLLNPWDLQVDDQCYVVVDLDPKIDWQFTKQMDAVTTKEPFGNRNSNLRHINQSGIAISNAMRSVENCRIVCFEVVQRDFQESEGFNFHVEIFNRAANESIEIIFDPDISNNGGTGIPKPGIAP
jgi:hypothetical protein